MGDRRHQKDGRCNWSKEFQATCKKIYGFWTFYKMDSKGETKVISEAAASLEIRNKKYNFAEVLRSGDLELQNEMTNYKPVELLKKGERIQVAGFTYWADFTAPAKKAFEMKAAA